MGHVNPTLGLGKELIRRGHALAWISLDPGLAARLPEGGELLLIAPEQPSGMEPETDSYLNRINSKIVYGIESIKFLYEDVLIPLNRYMYPGILAYLKTQAPDVVISDQQLFAGAMAARMCDIPFAVSVTAPASIKVMEDLPRIREWELGKIMALQKELQVDGEKPLDSSPNLNLVFTSRPFFGDMDLPPHYKFVGPALSVRKVDTPFDWDKFHTHKDRPRILVSIGTTFDLKFKTHFFSKVTEAFWGSHYTVILVADPQLFESIPENFMVYPSIPQLEILPFLDAVVCHGGNNTVCESLSFGLPMVVIPIAYDQSHMAGRVVEVGAGVRLNFNRFKPAQLRQAVADLLADASYARRAKEMGESFRQAGGGAQASMYVEELTAIPRMVLDESMNR